MAEISDLLMKKIQQKFPVMNIIKGEKGGEYRGTLQEREIAGHKVTLVIGISNVIVINAEIIEDG
jgi:hypothetical protein